MTADTSSPTPEQAREQLRVSRDRSLRRDPDRRRHAIATALLGLAVGLSFAAQNLVSGAGHVVRSALFLAAWLAVWVWVERVTRTVPRQARRWTRLGVAGSILLALGAVLPYLNLQEQSEPNTWPMALVAGIVIALPSLAAAALIARGPR